MPHALYANMSMAGVARPPRVVHKDAVAGVEEGRIELIERILPLQTPVYCHRVVPDHQAARLVLAASAAAAPCTACCVESNNSYCVVQKEQPIWEGVV